MIFQVARDPPKLGISFSLKEKHRHFFTKRFSMANFIWFWATWKVAAKLAHKAFLHWPFQLLLHGIDWVHTVMITILSHSQTPTMTTSHFSMKTKNPEYYSKLGYFGTIVQPQYWRPVCWLGNDVELVQRAANNNDIWASLKTGTAANTNVLVFASLSRLIQCSESRRRHSEYPPLLSAQETWFEAAQLWLCTAD